MRESSLEKDGQQRKRKRAARRGAGYWQQVMAEQRESGRSICGYCASAGVSEVSFYYWRRKFASTGTGSRQAAGAGGGAVVGVADRQDRQEVFIELQSISVAGGRESGVRLELPDGTRVELARDFSPEVLREALQVIGRLAQCSA